MVQLIMNAPGKFRDNANLEFTERGYPSSTVCSRVQNSARPASQHCEDEDYDYISRINKPHEQNNNYGNSLLDGGLITGALAKAATQSVMNIGHEPGKVNNQSSQTDIAAENIFGQRQSNDFYGNSNSSTFFTRTGQFTDNVEPTNSYLSDALTRIAHRRSSASSCLSSTLYSNDTAKIPPPPPLQPKPATTFSCRFCSVSFSNFSDFEYHAIKAHIEKNNPVPRVEMNYIENPETTVRIGENGEILRINEPRHKVNQTLEHKKLKLKFCKEKGQYKVKQGTNASPQRTISVRPTPPPLHPSPGVNNNYLPSSHCHTENSVSNPLPRESTLSISQETLTGQCQFENTEGRYNYELHTNVPVDRPLISTPNLMPISSNPPKTRHFEPPPLEVVLRETQTHGKSTSPNSRKIMQVPKRSNSPAIQNLSHAQKGSLSYAARKTAPTILKRCLQHVRKPLQNTYPTNLQSTSPNDKTAPIKNKHVVSKVSRDISTPTRTNVTSNVKSSTSTATSQSKSSQNQTARTTSNSIPIKSETVQSTTQSPIDHDSLSKYRHLVVSVQKDNNQPPPQPDKGHVSCDASRKDGSNSSTTPTTVAQRIKREPPGTDTDTNSGDKTKSLHTKTIPTSSQVRNLKSQTEEKMTVGGVGVRSHCRETANPPNSNSHSVFQSDANSAQIRKNNTSQDNSSSVSFSNENKSAEKHGTSNDQTTQCIASVDTERTTTVSQTTTASAQSQCLVGTANTVNETQSSNITNPSHQSDLELDFELALEMALEKSRVAEEEGAQRTFSCTRLNGTTPAETEKSDAQSQPAMISQDVPIPPAAIETDTIIKPTIPLPQSDVATNNVSIASGDDLPKQTENTLATEKTGQSDGAATSVPSPSDKTMESCSTTKQSSVSGEENATQGDTLHEKDVNTCTLQSILQRRDSKDSESLVQRKSNSTEEENELQTPVTAQTKDSQEHNRSDGTETVADSRSNTGADDDPVIENESMETEVAHDAEDHYSPSSPNPQPEEADDFECQVCNKNFQSDEELNEHFSTEHFRVAGNGCILEPESPYPPTPQSRLFGEESGEEVAPLRNNVHEANNIGRFGVNPPPVYPMNPSNTVNMRPNEPSTLEMVRRLSGSSEYLSNPHQNALAQLLRQNQTANVSSGLNRSVGPLQSMERQYRPPMAQHPSSQPRPMNMNPRISPPSIVPDFSDDNIPSNLLPRALTEQTGSQRPQFLQHPQNRHPVMSSNAGRGPVLQSQNPSHLPFNNSSSIPMSSQPQQLMRPHMMHPSMEQTRARSMVPPLNYLGNMQSVRRPQPIDHRPHGNMPYSNVQYMRQPSRYPTCPPVQRQSNPPMPPVRNMLPPPTQPTSQPKRTAVDVGGIEISEIRPSKQPRMEDIRPTRPLPPAEIRPILNNSQSSNQQQPPALNRPATSSTVRLSNAITLSVCTSSVSGPSGTTNSTDTNRSPTSKSPSEVTSVLAPLVGRGVTVTPASPPVRNISPVAGTSTGGSNPRAQHASVIQRGPNSLSPDRHFSPPVITTVRGSLPPTTGNQDRSGSFAVPRAPAPRNTTVNLNVDRPERPPTVDLTEDDDRSTSNKRPVPPAIITSRFPRPVTCSICSVLFQNIQQLESHKLTAHGVRQMANMGPRPSALQVTSRPSLVRDNRPVTTQYSRPTLNTSTARPPAAAQVRATATASIPTRAPNSNSNKFLYVPLLDLNKMDESKLKRLEEIGISSVVPLGGNPLGPNVLGIPVMNLHSELGLNNTHVPWDSMLPMGPVQSPSELLSQRNGSSRNNVPRNL